ncbi:hypothetical protein ACHQM5_028507 [Ranunculus cassubicifolius]
MKPGSYPKEMNVEAPSSNKTSIWMPTSLNCPQGTVPIRRATNEDLRRINSFTESYRTVNIHPQTKAHPGKQFAILKTHGTSNTYRGASAFMNVQQPAANDQQSSAAQLYVETTVDRVFNSLQAGWIVAYPLYGDRVTHLFAYWETMDYEGDKNGCFNTLCPGFIQTSPDVPLDFHVHPISIYGGQQYSVELQIFQDKVSGNWWLVFQKIYIGYWPSSIVPQLSRNGAMYLAWGGTGTSHHYGAPSPPLGTGKVFNYTWFDGTRQSYFDHVKIIDGDMNVVDPRDKEVETYADNDECYGAEYYGYAERSEHFFSYGGPGGPHCDTPLYNRTRVDPCLRHGFCRNFS